MKQMKVKNMLRLGIGSLLFFLLVYVSWQVFMNPIKSEALTEEEAKQVATDRFSGDVKDANLDNDIYEITLKLDTGEYQINISRSSGDIIDAKRVKEETPEKELTEADAKEIIKQKEIGEIEDIQKEEKDTGTAYEAVVKNEQQKVYLTLDAETGEITKEEEEEVQASKDQNTKKSSKSSEQDKKESSKKEQQNITTEEAIQIALDTVYGEVDDVDLEDEDGQLYYEIEIETDDDLEAEIQIHAITGEVISIEWDD